MATYQQIYNSLRFNRYLNSRKGIVNNDLPPGLTEYTILSQLGKFLNLLKSKRFDTSFLPVISDNENWNDFYACLQNPTILKSLALLLDLSDSDDLFYKHRSERYLGKACKNLLNIMFCLHVAGQLTPEFLAHILSSSLLRNDEREQLLYRGDGYNIDLYQREFYSTKYLSLDLRQISIATVLLLQNNLLTEENIGFFINFFQNMSPVFRSWHYTSIGVTEWINPDFRQFFIAARKANISIEKITLCISSYYNYSQKNSEGYDGFKNLIRLSDSLFKQNLLDEKIAFLLELDFSHKELLGYICNLITQGMPSSFLTGIWLDRIIAAFHRGNSPEHAKYLLLAEIMQEALERSIDNISKTRNEEEYLNRQENPLIGSVLLSRFTIDYNQSKSVYRKLMGTYSDEFIEIQTFLTAHQTINFMQDPAAMAELLRRSAAILILPPPNATHTSKRIIRSFISNLMREIFMDDLFSSRDADLNYLSTISADKIPLFLACKQAKIMTKCQENNLTLSPQGIQLLAATSHMQKNSLIGLFSILNTAGLLTDDNITLLHRHAGILFSTTSPWGCLNEWCYSLNARGLLTQERFELLLMPENNYLLTVNYLPTSRCRVFDKIPEHMITEDLFNTLVGFNQTANPRFAYKQHLEALPAPNQVQPQHVAAAPIVVPQTTHRPSVHASVANSLKRLELYYKLSDSQINTQVKDFKKLIQRIESNEFSNLDQQQAKRAINGIRRLIGLMDADIVQEEQTRFSLKKIIVLIWKGATDISQHCPNSFSAIDRLLYEIGNIQIEYSSIASNNSSPSCPGGTINGLVASLSDSHRLVFVELLNEEALASDILLTGKEAFRKEIETKFQSFHASEALRKEMLQSEQWINEDIHAWFERLLSQIISNAKQTFEQHIETSQAQYTPEQKRIILDTYKRERWIENSARTLRENKYLLVAALQKPERKVRDDFEQLIEIIEVAKSRIIQKNELRERRLKRLSQNFEAAPLPNFLEIEPFIAHLKDKNIPKICTWLDEHKIHLIQGEMGKTINALLSDLTVHNIPFGCKEISELDKDILTYAHKEEFNLESPKKSL